MSRAVRTFFAVAVLVLLGAIGATTASAATVVADSGFRPNPNGFSFENYGSDSGNQNLTPTEMRRIYGPGVCADDAGGQCLLSPPAQQWMENENQNMGGGHCYGFSTLSLLLWKHQNPPFGPGSTYSYRIEGNSALQHAIAYAFIFQDLPAVQNSLIRGTPNEVLQSMIRLIPEHGQETYGLGIFKMDDTGGHEVTPFQVVNKGAGIYGVEIYDNNYPGETREMRFDTNANTWQYNAAPNPQTAPELYSGNAGHPGIDLDPNTPGLGTQPCPFCNGSAAPDGVKPKPSPSPRNLVQLIGGKHHAHLLIKNSGGQTTGTESNGKVVNGIPGAQVFPILEDTALDFHETKEPLYQVPEKPDSIAIDAHNLHSSDTERVTSIGPGHDIAIDKLTIGPNETDVLAADGGDNRFSFSTSKGQKAGSPTIHIGSDSSKADYALSLRLVSFRGGSTLHVHLKPAQRKITFNATGNSGSATYVFTSVKETASGDHKVRSVTVHLKGTQSVTLPYDGGTSKPKPHHHGQPHHHHGQPSTSGNQCNNKSGGAQKCQSSQETHH